MVEHKNYDHESQRDGYGRNRYSQANDDPYPVDNSPCTRGARFIFFGSCAIIVMFILFFLVIFLPIAVQEPHLPQVEIKPKPNVFVLNVSSYQVMSNWDIVFSFRNPNKITVSFDQVNVGAFDGDHKPISKNATISPFIIGPKEATEMHATFENVTMDVDAWNSYDGTGHGTCSGMTTLNTTLTIARYKSRKRLSKTWVEVKCDNIKVLFSSNSNMSTIVGTNECRVTSKPLGVQKLVDKMYVYGKIVAVGLVVVMAIISIIDKKI